jgi:hypothetical protein
MFLLVRSRILQELRVLVQRRILLLGLLLLKEGPYPIHIARLPRGNGLFGTQVGRDNMVVRVKKVTASVWCLPSNLCSKGSETYTPVLMW